MPNRKGIMVAHGMAALNKAGIACPSTKTQVRPRAAVPLRTVRVHESGRRNSQWSYTQMRSGHFEQQGRVRVDRHSMLFKTWSLPPSLKNMVWSRAGLHQTIISAVRTSTRAGKISAGTDLPTQRSATPFCQGLWMEVCTAVICRERRAEGTSRPFFLVVSDEQEAGSGFVRKGFS